MSRENQLTAEENDTSKQHSLSVIVPALNEAGNITHTIDTIKRAAQGNLSQYEIIIVNDGSTDATKEICEELVSHSNNIHLINNPINKGIGFSFNTGCLTARYENIVMIPGDNEIEYTSIQLLFKKINTTDVLLLYTQNTQVRSLKRRIISLLFIKTLNLCFNLNVKYYNGPCVIKTHLLRQVPLKRKSFAYMAAIVVRLLKSGATYLEIGMSIQPRQYGGSKALSLKNLLTVFYDIFLLWVEIYIQKKRYITK